MENRGLSNREGWERIFKEGFVEYFMREETKKWTDRARSDFVVARNSLDSKDYGWACFQAQQSAEKFLKAILIEETKNVSDEKYSEDEVIDDIRIAEEVMEWTTKKIS